MAYKKERLNFEELSKFLIDFDIKIKNILSLKTNGKLNKEKNEVIIK